MYSFLGPSALDGGGVFNHTPRISGFLSGVNEVLALTECYAA